MPLNGHAVQESALWNCSCGLPLHRQVWPNWQRFTVRRDGTEVYFDRFSSILEGLCFCLTIHMKPLQAWGITMKTTFVRFNHNRDPYLIDYLLSKVKHGHGRHLPPQREFDDILA
jgi:hypothetical protein